VRDTETPEVLAERGETLIALGDDSGYAMLEQAVAVNAALPFAQMALAEHYQEQGDDDLYTIALIDAIEADPDLVYAMYYSRIAESLADQESFWNYVRLFGQATPTVASTFNLGRVLLLAPGFEREAVAAFENATHMDPTEAQPFAALGSSWLALGDAERAIANFEQATKLHFPTYPEGEWHKSPSAYHLYHAYLGLALVYADHDRFLESAQAAVHLLDTAPDELNDHCETLLNAYSGAATKLLNTKKAQDTQAAYDLLNIALPLAEYCENASIMLLLGTAQARIGTSLRQKRIFAEAVEWLEAGVATLRNVPATDGELAASQRTTQLNEAERELKLARQQR
jgi:hypothetical protein